MGLRDSEPQAMLVDEPCEAACSAEALAAVFTCAELQSLLRRNMPPPDVEVVEDALALRFGRLVGLGDVSNNEFTGHGRAKVGALP